MHILFSTYLKSNYIKLYVYNCAVRPITDRNISDNKSTKKVGGISFTGVGK